MWMILDYSMDFLYLLDVIFIKPRVMYLEDGFWVRDPKLTSKNYFQKVQFKVSTLWNTPTPVIFDSRKRNRLQLILRPYSQMDVLSLLPLDLLYFKYGEYHPIFRTPRLLKVTSTTFFQKIKPLERERFIFVADKNCTVLTVELSPGDLHIAYPFTLKYSAQDRSSLLPVWLLRVPDPLSPNSLICTRRSVFG